MDDQPYQEIYFIGIALPSELTDEISRIKWQLYEGDKAALKPLLPHVTLLNPPSLRGIMPSELIPRVREAAERYLPLSITLTGVNNFGRRVCVLDADSYKLEMLQSNLVKLLPPEAQASHYKRPYTPHVTMLQVYEPAIIDMDHAKRRIEGLISFPLTFTVDNVTYFKRIVPREYRPASI